MITIYREVSPGVFGLDFDQLEHNEVFRLELLEGGRTFHWVVQSAFGAIHLIDPAAVKEICQFNDFNPGADSLVVTSELILGRRIEVCDSGLNEPLILPWETQLQDIQRRVDAYITLDKPHH